MKRNVLLSVAIALAACTTGTEVEPTTTSISTTTSTAVTTSSTTKPLPECIEGTPEPGIDRRYEDIIRAYETRNPERLAGLIGDGPVWDPSLEPEGDDLYPNLAAWLEAASRMEDQWFERGSGFYEPFQLFLERRNPTLGETGIEGLNITFELWVTQDCELRVGTTDIISRPDPCRYFELYDPEATPEGCLGPFEPRAAHVAVWTGEEVIIYGGTTGVDLGQPLRSGLAYNPATGAWREITPSPLGQAWWPQLKAFWADDRMLVVGKVEKDGAHAIRVLAYSPDADTWSVSAPAPEERGNVGAVVWTGEEVVLVGGDNNAPDDTAWAYRPSTDEWRQLPDPGIDPVEGMEGVWTGTEAIFAGGYIGAEPFPAVAYRPNSESWRQLPAPLGRQLDDHEMVWTGRQVILYSGHSGPSHLETLLIYDPASDAWSESSPMPMAPAKRLAGAWTGDRLIIWGGYATYNGMEDDEDHVFDNGASFDPVTDTWELLPEAPISDRCDHSGTWTGTEFIVFGGRPLCASGVVPLGDAAAYNPATNTWRLIEK